MKFLSDEMISGLLPAETSTFPSPVPTQIVSSDEYLPVPQTEKQREVEARLREMSDRLARRQGQSRRRFFQTASGMAASFVALNQVFGPLFDASEAEAATPELADARASALSGQMVIDGHTHFLRDDTRLMAFVKGREAVGQWGWNKELAGKEQTIDDLKYGNYVARFSFPFIELQAKHKAFIEREMDDFLPRSFDPRDVIPEEEAMSRGWEDPEQAAIDFNAENL